MHEFSLASNIVEIVNESAKNANADIISEIHLEIGSISGVEIEALLTAMDALTSGTSLEHTKIKIEHIEAEAECLNCRHWWNINELFELCPNCQSLQIDIVKGKEFRIKSIVAEETGK